MGEYMMGEDIDTWIEGDIEASRKRQKSDKAQIARLIAAGDALSAHLRDWQYEPDEAVDAAIATWEEAKADDNTE